MVRSIYDRTKVPILLVGMTDLLRKLRSHKKFWSRIGLAHYFAPLSLDQLADYIQNLHPLFGEETDDKLVRFIFRKTRGEFRRINRLVKQAHRICRTNDLDVFTTEVFEKASELVLDFGQ